MAWTLSPGPDAFPNSSRSLTRTSRGKSPTSREDPLAIRLFQRPCMGVTRTTNVTAHDRRESSLPRRRRTAAAPRTFLALSSHLPTQERLALSSHEKWPTSHGNLVKVRALSPSL